MQARLAYSSPRVNPRSGEFCNNAEQTAFRSSRLIAFIFAPALQKGTLLKKMERLMVIWPTIEAQVGLVQSGSMFEIPVKGDRLRPL